VVPDPEVLAKWVEAHPELARLDKKALLESKELKATVLSQMEAKAKEYGLSGIERVKKVHITASQFAVTNDLVTPTFKLKRFNAKKFFQEQIEEMYSEGI
jgi:long-chain acyl-CoA synthetase